MKTWFIDFETRSTVDIRTVGAFRYAAHPDTEILCIAWDSDHGDHGVWAPVEVTRALKSVQLAQLPPIILPGDCIVAHNAEFERCMWTVFRRLVHVPSAEQLDWWCTAALARFNGVPGALDAAGAFLRWDVQKDVVGRAAMLKLSKPRPGGKFWTFEERPGLFEKLFTYCNIDVAVSKRIWESLAHPTGEWRTMFYLIGEINRFGVRMDRPTISAFVRGLTALKSTLERKAHAATGGIRLTQVERLKDWIAGYGLPRPESLDKGARAAMLENPDIPPTVRDVLELKDAVGGTTTAKLQTMLDRMDDDDRMRGALTLCGADRTGRFASYGAQMHNLMRPRGLDTLDVIERVRAGAELQSVDEIARSLRSLIISGDGRTLYGADLNAIEARLVLWNAGDEKHLDMFRRGHCLYREMATSIYPLTYGDIGKDSEERQVGKQVVLGAGYQMGGAKFQRTLKTFTGIEKSLGFCTFVIERYRAEYWKVVRLWYGVERAAIAAVRHSGMTFAAGRLKFKRSRRHDCLLMLLPSGRCIRYWFPKVEEAPTPWGEMRPKLSYQAWNRTYKRLDREYTYGGKLLENATQGISADILVFIKVNLSAAGFMPVMSIHDEPIAEADRAGRLGEYLAIMETAPPWAPDLPLKAEGFEGSRYVKT